VIVSHNHYDHMDEWTLSELEKKDSPLFIVPLANKKFLEYFGARNIVELDWWEKHTFKELEITLAPAQHWSSRTPFDRMQALWGSFFIKDQKNSFYFAGDTGYGDHFKTIKERLGSPQISFIPIGAYEPRWFMKDSHMNPEDALLAHQDLMSESSIGMHFGMFQLTDEGIDDPALELEELKLKGKITNFVALKPGDVFSR
jgi:L-ascorbate metabolism protein UlaG (beta-lactamase superfamily)